MLLELEAGHVLIVPSRWFNGCWSGAEETNDRFWETLPVLLTAEAEAEVIVLSKKGVLVANANRRVPVEMDAIG